ncbi:kyphoscoliosis peptidase-like [Mixophyes fleayi]|uniref:kyphoscoliosis peptidase-like n=1 Tax=Mixophyes fleayi TaxID=3061075 RepID=UPI003F4DC086
MQRTDYIMISLSWFLQAFSDIVSDPLICYHRDGLVQPASGTVVIDGVQVHVEKENTDGQKRKKQVRNESLKFKYPWDQSILKSLELDLNKFEKLDAYAAKLESKESLEHLTKELLRDAHTDLEKTRAIWIWICHHIEYDIIGYKNKAMRSTVPDEIFRSKRGVCAGYSSLFQDMCRIADVKCKTVSGYGKGAGYKVGQKIPDGSNHAWNIVYLEGSWHLLDSTWGAGKTDTKFKFQYDEFYFLTHPAVFIEDHYPNEAECQLLKPVVSRKHFEQSVSYNSQFYTSGILSCQPETAVIKTVNGKVSIAIKSRHNLLFTFDLSENKKSGVMKLVDCGMKLDVYPDKTGQHVLKVFAMVPGSGKVYHYVLSYIIECNSVDTRMKIPKSLINPVGPSWVSEEAGLVQPSHPDPVIHTENGCGTINFAVKRDLRFLCTLHSDEVQMTSEMESRHIFLKKTKDKVKMKVRLPQSGTYVLCVFIKPGKSNHTNYTYLCNYLIISTNTSVRWPVFPLTYSKWAKHYDLVQPLEGVLPKNSNVSFRLHIPGVTGVCVNGESYTPLTLADNGYWEGTCSTDDRKELSVMIKYMNEPNTWHYLLKYDNAQEEEEEEEEEDTHDAVVEDAHDVEEPQWEEAEAIRQQTLVHLYKHLHQSNAQIRRS